MNQTKLKYIQRKERHAMITQEDKCTPTADENFKYPKYLANQYI